MLRPDRGVSSVEVTLIKRDPKINVPVQVHDLDLSIKYRKHRHFQEKPILY